MDIQTFIMFNILCTVSFTNSNNVPARLLISKVIQNKFMVEGQDILIRYNIFNVGDSIARNILLTDDNFSEENFKLVAGFYFVEWERLSPGSNVTHSVVIHPRIFGHINFTSAKVEYHPLENSETRQIGWSSEPGHAYIVPALEFKRKFSAHVLDWFAFALMTMPSVSIPYLLWWHTKNKYEIKKLS